MLRNYFKIAWRNLLRNRFFSAINIIGLAIGLACSLMITLYVKDELSYDRHHVNADRIYRLSRTFLSKDGTVSLRLGHTAPPFGPLIREDFGEVEQIVRMLETGALMRYGDLLFEEENVFAAEQNLFKIFSFEVLQGNPDKALENPFSIMFSRPMAEKYFGKEDPRHHLVYRNIGRELSCSFPDFLSADQCFKRKDRLCLKKREDQTDTGNNTVCHRHRAYHRHQGSV